MVWYVDCAEWRSEVVRVHGTQLRGALQALRPFIPTVSCLLVLATCASTQRAHAQGGPLAVSYNQTSVANLRSSGEPSIERVSARTREEIWTGFFLLPCSWRHTSRPTYSLCLTTSALKLNANSQEDLTAPTEPQLSQSPSVKPNPKEGRWFTRLGVLVAPYHSGATIATNGRLLFGGTAKASNNMSVTFDLGYQISRNFSVTVTSGIPVKPHVTGEGTAASLGILGKVRYGPMIFAGQYRFPKVGRFRPYAGGGAAYAIIFKNFDGTVKDLKVHNNWGSMVQGGVEYEVNSKYTMFMDFKQVWLSVNADGVLSDGTQVKARVKLNPSLVTVGIKFYLPFKGGR